MSGLRVLACGGREFDNRDFVYRTLDAIHEQYGVEILIEGGARGADRLAADWAFARQRPYKHYPADWNRHGKAAGPIRNQQMLDDGKPHLVVAFPGGVGTADMIRRAEKSGIQVVRHSP